MKTASGTRQWARPARRAGYTLVELLVALFLGVLILGSAMTFLIVQLGTLEGSDIRENVSRNGRYVGAALRHDLQRAGIGMESTISFGTVGVWPGSYGDTLAVLYIPYVPDWTVPHRIIPPPGTDNPLLPGGTCGDRCIDVLKDAGEPFDIAVGDLTRLQVGGTRRLIIVDNLTTTSDTSVAVEWTDDAKILNQSAGLANGLRLDRFGTYVQGISPIVYYLDDQARLMRAVELNRDGSPKGEVLAYGVEEFDIRLIFADGDELEKASGGDPDDSNDYDDIVGVRARVTVRAERTDPRVNDGKLLTRTYEWVVSPRNLRYEKNR